MTTTPDRPAPIWHHGRRVCTVPTLDNAGNPARAEVTVTLEIRPAQAIGRGLTVEHEPIPPDALAVSLVGARRRGRVDDGGGQIVDDLRDPERQPLDGLEVADLDRIADLWDRWHLNEMRAACAHMPRTLDDLARIAPAGLPQRYGKPDVVGWAIEHVRCAADTGYRYGTAWLYEPVPGETLDELRAYFPDPLAARGYDLYGKPTR